MKSTLLIRLLIPVQECIIIQFQLEIKEMGFLLEKVLLLRKISLVDSLEWIYNCKELHKLKLDKLLHFQLIYLHVATTINQKSLAKSQLARNPTSSSQFPTTKTFSPFAKTYNKSTVKQQ